MRLGRWIGGAVAVVLAGGMALPAQAAAILKNGSFESVKFTKCLTAQNGHHFGPWLVEPRLGVPENTADIASVFDTQPQAGGLTVGEGARSLALGCNGAGTAARVSQSFPTTPGATYNVAYMVGAAVDNALWQIDLDDGAWLSGTQVAPVSGSSWSGIRHASFVATGSSSKISLTGTRDGSHAYGPLFDHIRVTAAP